VAVRDTGVDPLVEQAPHRISRIVATVRRHGQDPPGVCLRAAKAATPDTENPYAFQMGGLRTRDKDNEHAQPAVPLEEAQELANAATRRALAFKQAIRSGTPVRWRWTWPRRSLTCSSLA
jgi:hypothetical protein